ncbi:cytochrome P450 ClCP1 [Leptodontidium sp. MPI-SDFR-AT-0119]|nr:cytochrome P450 ClCP1 [Leptodontidium sp. MPI-SDFR-AT-0119]
MATYTDLERLMRILAPTGIKKARLRHEEYVRVNTKERLAKGNLPGRPDFLSYILKSKGTEDELTEKEVEANCGFLILAGSETIATALSGTTYYLLKTPAALKKVTEEVRNAFEKEEDINFLNCAAKLPYTLACFTEGLRFYPPGPTTCVGVHALAASHSPSNFHLPTSFIPERWFLEVVNDPTSPFHNDRRGASQPFSFGPRNCLGKSLAYNEMRVMLARLLWNFDLELADESQDWAQQKTYTFVGERKPDV